MSYGKLKKFAVQLTLVVIILAVGAGAVVVAIRLREEPEIVEEKKVAPLVNVMEAKSRDVQMRVKGFGTVEPKIEVQVVPQVGGKVVRINEDFVNGGFFDANELLVKIDPEDYLLAVEAARADVASARVELDREQAEAEVALREWRQLNPDREPTSPLVLRKPQIESAKARLEAAKANLKTAELNLERTEISMPFDGRVYSESVDIGQQVSPGEVIGRVYGTRIAQIVVPLDDKQLEWFDVPLVSRKNNLAEATKAIVWANFAGERYRWDSKVVRTQGMIDATSRMVNVVVQVENPFDVNEVKPPLVPGMFVEVEIIGETVGDVIELPRYAIHNGDEVWVVRDGKLNIEKVKIIRLGEELAYITSGVESGELVVLSPLDAVIDGMEIRVEMISDSR